MKNALAYSIFAGLFGVLILPFIVIDSMFFPLITSKVFVFRIGVEILLGLWLILIIKNKEYRPRLSLLMSSVAIFTLVLFIANIFAIDSYKAFWGNFERMEGWLTIIHLFVYFVIMGSMFASKKIWFSFFRVSVYISAFMSLFAITEIIQHGATRISSTLGNPIYLSSYFLFNIFFTIILLNEDIFNKNINKRASFHRSPLFYFYIAIIGLSVYFIYLSSRGVLLGLVSGLLLTMFLIAILERKHLILKRISIIGIVVGVLLIAGFISMRESDFVKNNSTLHKIATISWNNKADPAGQSRQLVWQMSLTSFNERPFLGWGQENFRYLFNKNYDPKIYALVEDWFDRAHNTPLDFLIAGGIVGLISYISIFVTALYLLWRKLDASIFFKSTSTGLFAGYFIQGLFVFDTITTYILFFTFLAYIHSKSVSDIIEQSASVSKTVSVKTKKEYKDENSTNYILVATLTIFVVGVIWWLNMPAFYANVDLRTATELNKKGRLAESFEMYKKALSWNSFGDAEIREQLLTRLSKDIVNSQDTAISAKKEEYLQFAFDQGKEQIRKTPDDARFYYIVGSFLNAAGNPSMALDYLNKARDLMPNFQPIHFARVKALWVLERKEEALQEAKLVYELDPTITESKIFYASALAYNHRDDLIDTLISDPSIPFEKIQNVYMLLASEAYKAGDKAKAVFYVKKLIERNADFKENGERAITAIWDGSIKFTGDNLVTVPLK